MNGVQKAIFPGVVIGVALLVGLTSWIARPDTVEAASSLTLPLVAAQEDAGEPAQPADPPADEDQAAVASDGCSLGGAFPGAVRQWCELIEQAAAEEGLDPQVVAALIVQESGGDPNAYSASGAVGLMQVMPRDGIAAGFQCINGPCFASRPSMAELSDPTFNVRYGTQMLAGLVRKYGSLRDALYAYGPANVGYSYADKGLAIYENYRK
jgi:soluble lytic murein transglycosylase-like protein